MVLCSVYWEEKCEIREEALRVNMANHSGPDSKLAPAQLSSRRHQCSEQVFSLKMIKLWQLLIMLHYIALHCISHIADVLIQNDLENTSYKTLL